MGRARARPGARTARRPAGDEPNSDPHVNATPETSPADPRRPAGSAAFRAEVAARKERGARAEAAVAAYLAAQGLEILGMNVRVGRLEIDVVALDDALERLAQLDPRRHRVVELRYFGGLSVEDVASLLGVSVTTVEADWRGARAWLSVQLGT